MEKMPEFMRRMLDQSFSGRYTAITEMLQNCRRAGATRIDIELEDSYLRITDDGCGITDPAALFVAGMSGWSEEVMLRDEPFGLGFRAALLNCDEIAVVSRFGTLPHTATAALLNGDMPEPTGGPSDVTTITLFNPKIEEPRTVINWAARAFPVPIYLNGECLNADRLRAVCIHKDDHCELWVDPLAEYKTLSFTVQGLPVEVPVSDANKHDLASVQYDGRYRYDMNGRPFSSGAMWLELKGAKVRMPDRDKVLEFDAAVPNPLSALYNAVVGGKISADAPLALSAAKANQSSDMYTLVCEKTGMELRREYGYKYPDNGFTSQRYGDPYFVTDPRWVRPKSPAWDPKKTHTMDHDETIAMHWFEQADASFYDGLSRSPDYDTLRYDVEIVGDYHSIKGVYVEGFGKTDIIYGATEYLITPVFLDAEGNELFRAVTVANDGDFYDNENDVIYVEGSTPDWTLGYQGGNWDEDSSTWDESAFNNAQTHIKAAIAAHIGGDDALPTLLKIGADLPPGTVTVTCHHRNGTHEYVLAHGDKAEPHPDLKRFRAAYGDAAKNIADALLSTYLTFD